MFGPAFTPGLKTAGSNYTPRGINAITFLIVIIKKL